ncbi:MAG: UDP-N-acetylmuramoyl-L-alanine--D-glutamate ligase [Actinomycetaceae bacterium]|nr:UDP-N-acetylmuramoyl-L-alanine--D-glutamate ligase [Actinomycetaceae bacterium]
MNTAIIGLGRSGLAAAEVLSTLGHHLVGVDGSEDALEGADLPAGTDRYWAKNAADLAQYLQDKDVTQVVMSPGVAPDSALFEGARASGAEIVGEVELAWRLAHSRKDCAPWLCVTGTNGKTTTVQMTQAILRTGGVDAYAVGNVGEPVVLRAAQGGYDALVVELSSFQLHLNRSISPWAAVCLNVASDHLDWHGSVENYRADKALVYERTQKACLFPVQEKYVPQMVENADVVEGARAIGLNFQAPAVGQIGVVDDLLVDRAFVPNRWHEASVLASFADLRHLAGGQITAPVLADAQAAAGLARAVGVDCEAVSAGLRGFTAEAHRREVVAVARDLTWINDSKATNAHAARVSLLGMGERSVVWIAGGDSKGQSFDDLVQAVAPTLRGVVLIGKDRRPLASALRNFAPGVPVVECEPPSNIMDSVVHECVALSRPGDTVILAPACASWDQFPNYRVRGDEFVAAVKTLEDD